VSADNERLLQSLLDERDIRAVIARYARSVDHSDWDALRSCYHPDATDAHGAHNGSVDDFLESSKEFVHKVDSMTHVMGQSTIEIDGDMAWVETYCLCLVRYSAKGEDDLPMDRVANLRYVDIFERRDEQWRIRHRKLVHHPSRLDPVLQDAVLADKALRARLDPDDPSYDRRPESFLI
jgi:ketosteroid isomerase-like protein